jgi:hypothetical protein
MNTKINCETCKIKLAIIVENKKYYCAECMLIKEGIQPLHQTNDLKEKNIKTNN